MNADCKCSARMTNNHYKNQDSSTIYNFFEKIWLKVFTEVNACGENYQT